MFVVTLTYVKPLAETDALIPAHIAWLERQYAAGHFLASGRRVPRVGGVILSRRSVEHPSRCPRSPTAAF